VRWSELPPWQRRAELAKVHPDLTEAFLIADGLAVPELAPQIKAQKSKEDKVMVVVRYFGDEGHRQPEERGALAPLAFSLGDPDLASKMRQSPPWGRLPPLDDDQPSEDVPLLRTVDKSRGALLPAALIETALQRHERDGLGRRTLAAVIPGLTEWTAGQVLRWYEVGKPAGLWLDDDRLRYGPGITPVSPGDPGWEQGWEQRGGATSPTPLVLRLPRL
jgi:hypothetical protein